MSDTSSTEASPQESSGNTPSPKQRMLEKLAEAQKLKNEGNEAFKRGELSAAMSSYHKILFAIKGLLPNDIARAFTKNDSNVNEEEDSEHTMQSIQAQFQELMVQIYSNMAAVHLKKNNYKRTIECCEEALKLDPNNHKAKFREAQAYIGTGEMNKAKKLLTKLKEESKDPGVSKLLADITKGERSKEIKSNNELKGFFAKAKRPLYDDDEFKQTSAKITEITEDELKTSEQLGSNLQELKV